MDFLRHVAAGSEAGCPCTPRSLQELVVSGFLPESQNQGTTETHGAQSSNLRIEVSQGKAVTTLEPNAHARTLEFLLGRTAKKQLNKILKS